MKVAHLTWSMGIGGIETMLVDIVNEQVKTCEVRIYVINAYYDKELLDKIDKKVKIVLLNRVPKSRSVWPMLCLNVQLLLFCPDVIHCHQGNLASVIKGPFKKVLTLHNTNSGSVYLKKFDRLFCVSNAVKTYAAQQGFPDAILVYNGIHTEEISVKDYSKSSESNLWKMVCVGRLEKQKGQHLLIEAINVLVNSRKLTGFTVDLIGEGKERERLEQLVDDYGLRNFVFFLGKKQRIWFYPRLKDYNLFIMPSVSEAFGLTLTEAIAAKLPVLSCDLQGPMEILDGGRLGDTFKTGDVNALADGIEQFLKNGVNIQRTEDAYEYVKSNFDVNVTARKYIQEYKLLIKHI